MTRVLSFCNGLQGVATAKIHIVILSLLQKGEKSIEFKTRFEFMDTSPKAQYDKGSVILSDSDPTGCKAQATAKKSTPLLSF